MEPCLLEGKGKLICYDFSDRLARSRGAPGKKGVLGILLEMKSHGLDFRQSSEGADMLITW